MINSPRVADAEWFIPDPDPNFFFELRIRIRLGFLNSYHNHVGDCVTTSNDDKIVPENIKKLIKIFSNKRC